MKQKRKNITYVNNETFDIKQKILLLVDYDNISKNTVHDFSVFFKENMRLNSYEIVKFACKNCGRYNEADIKINTSLKDATDVKMIIYATENHRQFVADNVLCFLLTKDHFASSLSLFLKQCYHIRNIKILFKS